jgi:hypothetical protein
MKESLSADDKFVKVALGGLGQVVMGQDSGLLDAIAWF